MVAEFDPAGNTHIMNISRRCGSLHRRKRGPRRRRGWPRLGCPRTPGGRRTAADRPIDFYNNISTMYIYSDVVDFSIVGSVKTNLLQCCPLSGTYGQMIQHTFNPVRYLPIARDTIDTVTIDILSEFGKPFNFNWESTIVTLHVKAL